MKPPSWFLVVLFVVVALYLLTLPLYDHLIG